MKLPSRRRMPVLRCRIAPQLIAFRRIHQLLGPIMTQKNCMPANRQNMASASMPTAGPFPFHGLIGAVVIRHDIPRNRLPHHNILRQKPIPRKRNPLLEPGHRPVHHIRRQLLPPSVNPPDSDTPAFLAPNTAKAARWNNQPNLPALAKRRWTTHTTIPALLTTCRRPNSFPANSAENLPHTTQKRSQTAARDSSKPCAEPFPSPATRPATTCRPKFQ